MGEGAPRLSLAGDFELAGRAARGDRAAFGELVRRAAPPVTAFLQRTGASPAVADDLTQDALLAALRWMATYRGDAPFASWVIRIAARLYLKRIRKEARYDLRAEPVDLQAPGPCAGPASDRRLDLQRALASLSDVERLCVTLCHGAGLTHEDLARTLRIPLGTIKSHVTRGMRKLRAQIE